MDLNILISTIITATSALVAIIGGFLVSRVITLAGEKQSIEKRLKEINNDLKIKKEMLDNIERSILEDDIDDFIHKHCEQIILEEKNLQEILRDNDYYELTEEVLTPYIEELISIRDKVMDMIEKSDDLPNDFNEFIKKNGIKIERRKSWYETVYYTLLKFILNTSPQNPWNLLSFKPVLPTTITSVTSMNTISYRDKIKERDRLRNEVQFLSARKIEQEKILDEYSKPSGLWSGLMVLFYSCIVGIAYPCLLLPYPAGTYNDEKTKWLLISLFFSGLIAIFIYLAISMYKLTMRNHT